MALKTFEQEELLDRLNWFIRLRWLAASGVFIALLAVSNILRLKLPYPYLYIIASLILIYNCIFFLIYQAVLPKREFQVSLKYVNGFANIQISVDLFFLALLIHFSGGVENPFIFYFIFHMIIASILLSVRASYLQATFAVCMLISIAYSEYVNIIAHYCLADFIPSTLHANGIYILSVLFVFATTLYLSVYMTTSISKKLRQRSKELILANEKLLEQDRLKNEYVYRVTHNIKAHLSAIQGCLEPVLDEITGKINAQQKDLIERARARTDKLLFFVKALLKITQIRLARDWPTKEVSLLEILKRSIDTLDSKAKAKNIQIILDIPDTLQKIKVNEISVEEVFIDLIMNSIKYTPKDGSIYVSIKELKDNVLVEIKDTGIGIGKEDQKRLFEEFFRAQNAIGIERDGTGLGLSIVKQIIERHGGKVWAESEGLGKGSKFSFMLPKDSQEKEV